MWIRRLEKNRKESRISPLFQNITELTENTQWVMVHGEKFNKTYKTWSLGGVTQD